MRSLVLTFVVSVAFVSVGGAKDGFQAAEFVKQHLDSIGTEQVRASTKNRAAVGTVSFKLLNGSSGNQDGKQQFFSEGDKLDSLLKLPNTSYHGEWFISDGKRASIAQIKPGTYSNLGQFVFSHPEILTEGLWGGTLSTAWSLAHFNERNAKLQDQGLKKMDGRDLHRVDYVPKKHSDLEIQLYFDPETSRHVMTVYSLLVNAQIGQGEIATAHQQQTRYRLEERFSDFKNTGNLTLPWKWTIQFTSEVPQTDQAGSNGFALANTPVIQFEVTETDISNNVTLDPRNFEVK